MAGFSAPSGGSAGTGGKSASFPSYSGATSGGYYYNNLLATAQFLMSNGYSRAAAAGVAGAIAGESSGDPEAGGPGNAGLIQWTPESKAAPANPILTGDPSTDFHNQLTDILRYNDTNGPTSQLKSYSGSAVDAADFYSQNFERPAVTDSDVRAGVANNIYNALKGYKPDAAYTQYSGAGSSGGAPSSSAGIGDYVVHLWDSLFVGEGEVSQIEDQVASDSVSDMAQAIVGLTAPFAKLAEGLDWFFHPNHWIRIFSGLIGGAFLAFGIYSMTHVGHGGQVGGSVAGVPVGVDLPSSSLPVAIGATGVGFLGLYIALHNLPSSVATFPDLIGYLAGEVRNANTSGSSSG